MLKYIEIKEAIIRDINSGILKAGDQLLVRNELIKKYKVARPTLNRSISELIKEGYLIAFRNRGTFVSDKQKKLKIALISNIQNSDITLGNKNFDYRFESLKHIMFSYNKEDISFLNSKEVTKNFNILSSYNVIIWLMPSDSIIKKLKVYKHKVIIVNRYCDELNFISTNHRLAIKEMTEHFIDASKGNCNLIYLDRTVKDFINKERREGFIDGCESKDKFYRLCALDTMTFDEQVAKLMSLKFSSNKRNIIISPALQFTGAILRMAYLRNMQIGKDFDYADFDNDNSLETAGVPVPSILQDYKQMGVEIIDATNTISTQSIQKFIPYKMIYIKT